MFKAVSVSIRNQWVLIQITLFQYLSPIKQLKSKCSVRQSVSIFVRATNLQILCLDSSSFSSSPIVLHHRQWFPVASLCYSPPHGRHIPNTKVLCLTQRRITCTTVLKKSTVSLNFFNNLDPKLIMQHDINSSEYNRVFSFILFLRNDDE